MFTFNWAVKQLYCLLGWKAFPCSRSSNCWQLPVEATRSVFLLPKKATAIGVMSLEDFFISKRQFPSSPERSQRGKTRIIWKKTQEKNAQRGRKQVHQRDRWRTQNCEGEGNCKVFVGWKRDNCKQIHVLNIETMEINSPCFLHSLRSFDANQQSSSKRVALWSYGQERDKNMLIRETNMFYLCILLFVK